MVNVRITAGKKNGSKNVIYTQNKNASVEISRICNEEGRLRKFETHKIYSKARGKQEAGDIYLTSSMCE